MPTTRRTSPTNGELDMPQPRNRSRKRYSTSKQQPRIRPGAATGGSNPTSVIDGLDHLTETTCVPFMKGLEQQYAAFGINGRQQIKKLLGWT